MESGNDEHFVIRRGGSASTVYLVSFVHAKPYTDFFTQLELTDDEQRAIETVLMLDPLAGPIMHGTGGVRMHPLGIPNEGIGAFQLTLFYAYFPENRIIVLIDLAETEAIGPMTEEEQKELRSVYLDLQRHWG